MPGEAWTWDITQLASGPLDIEQQVAPFDDGYIGNVAVDRNALHQIHAGVDWGVVLLPAAESGATYVNGRRLVAGDAVVLPPASELELLTQSVACVYLVAFRAASSSARLGLRSPRLCTRADGRVGSWPDDCRAWLADSNANKFDRHRAATLQTRLHSWVQLVVAEAQRSEEAGPALPRRRVAVERVRRFIHEHLAESMTLAELCHHAHLQARSLEYGFRDLVGLSPFKYIKMLRLGEVRRRLRMSSVVERSVSEVALDCGFCHLSQFAADYKRVFLESPSATRRAFECSRPARLALYESAPAAVAAR